MGVARLTDYCASKHALCGLHESLAAELAGTGIRCLLVCPATMRTPMFGTLGPVVYPPPMDPDDVASRVVDAVLRRESGTVYLPRSFHLLPVYAALPLAAKIWLLRVLGTTDAVQSVRGTNPTLGGSPRRRRSDASAGVPA